VSLRPADSTSSGREAVSGNAAICSQELQRREPQKKTKKKKKPRERTPKISSTLAARVSDSAISLFFVAQRSMEMQASGVRAAAVLLLSMCLIFSAQV